MWYLIISDDLEEKISLEDHMGKELASDPKREELAFEAAQALIRKMKASGKKRPFSIKLVFKSSKELSWPGDAK